MAECQDCGWQGSNYKNALALAAQHHDRTGHTVLWEQLISGVYGKLKPTGVQLVDKTKSKEVE
jgi:hypothetical protein